MRAFAILAINSIEWCVIVRQSLRVTDHLRNSFFENYLNYEKFVTLEFFDRRNLLMKVFVKFLEGFWNVFWEIFGKFENFLEICTWNWLEFNQILWFSAILSTFYTNPSNFPQISSIFGFFSRIIWWFSSHIHFGTIFTLKFGPSFH